MVNQPIQIFARVKPPLRKHQQGIYSIDEDEKLTASLEIILPRDLADGFVNNKRESYKFKFQRIFDQDANQETIFVNIAKPVAERLHRMMDGLEMLHQGLNEEGDKSATPPTASESVESDSI